MANIFTSNQVNHVLVVTAITSNSGADKAAKNDSEGTLGIHKDADGKLYFTHKGKGGLTRSDLITNIESIRVTPAKSMEKSRKNVVVTLSEDANDGNPIVGQDYILKLKFQNPMGMSPDHEYWKHGIVHVVSSEATPSKFYFNMAKSIALNMSREAAKMVAPYILTVTTPSSYDSASTGGYAAGTLIEYNGKIYINKTAISSGSAAGTWAPDKWVEVDVSSPKEFSATTAYGIGDVVSYGGNIYVFKAAHSAGTWNSNHVTAFTATKVTPDSTLSDTVTAMALLLKENDITEWRLGIQQEKKLTWNVAFTEVTWINNNVTYTEKWGNSAEVKGDTVVNSRLAAEFEYFAMGERADLYRGMGWPDNRETKYIVNDESKYGYDMINIHYSYVGSNHAIQKSEKDLTLIVERVNTDNLIGTLTQSVETRLNTLLSLGWTVNSNNANRWG